MTPRLLPHWLARIELLDCPLAKDIYRVLNYLDAKRAATELVLLCQVADLERKDVCTGLPQEVAERSTGSSRTYHEVFDTKLSCCHGGSFRGSWAVQSQGQSLSMVLSIEWSHTSGRLA